MKKIVLTAFMIGLVTTLRAQEQDINLKYLAQFSCNEYRLNNFLSKETFNIEQCIEGFISVYQEGETQFSDENGPLLAKVIGVNLVSTLAEYNGCNIIDYCCEETKHPNSSREIFFLNDIMIEQCKAGFAFALDTTVQNYLGFKEALTQKMYFMEIGVDEKNAFYAGAVQSFRCH